MRPSQASPRPSEIVLISGAYEFSLVSNEQLCSPGLTSFRKKFVVKPDLHWVDDHIKPPQTNQPHPYRHQHTW
jgi:hypothetical protein